MTPMSESTVSEATATAEETAEAAAVQERLTLAQRQRLLRPLNQKRVKKNPKGFSYIPHNDSRAELIKTFGLCGYDLETISVDQVSFRSNDSGNRFWAVFRATVRLTVKDERGNPLAVYTASGAGAAQNLPSEGDAVDNAIKGAESEAFKRCVINLGDQYGLSLYDDGALESVGGSLVDSPVIQAATPQPAPAAPADPAQNGKDPRDDFETLKQAIRVVNSGDALTRVAARVQTAHVHRLITDKQRQELLELGAARRKALNEAVPSR
jgi:hypothetical protein